MPTVNTSTLSVVLENSNPNGIVFADPGTYLYRNGFSFSFLDADTTDIGSLALYQQYVEYYSTQPWFSTVGVAGISYAQSSETWYKNNGSGNTGWTFIGFGSYGVQYTPPSAPGLSLSYVSGSINPFDTVDFGPIPVSGSVDITFTITNTGQQSLIIDYIRIDSTTDFSASLQFVPPSPVITLNSFSSMSFDILATWDNPFNNGTLVIGNNATGIGPFVGVMPVQYDFPVSLIAEPM